MRGTQVIVRAFGNQALVRRVWDADKGAVYITNDEGLEKLEKGDPGAPWPIGFPRADVFSYDHKWLLGFSVGQGSPDWTKLKNWGG